MSTPIVLGASGASSLGAAIARSLDVAPGTCTIERFPDGEIHVEVRAVRGRDVFIVQPLGGPVGEALLELLLVADACHRGGAGSVSAVVPYLGYARQDRRTVEGQPLGAYVVAQALSTGRLARVLAIDLHAPAVEGLFAAPVEHLTAAPLLAAALATESAAGAVIVAPDLGAAKAARRFGARLGAPVAFVDKVRRSGSEVSAQRVAGDVAGLRPIVVDDMISTGGTIVEAVRAVLAAGAVPDVTVAATHGVFADGAAERLRGLPLRRLLVTDTLARQASWPEATEIVSVAPLLARAVGCIARDEPLGDLLAGR